ncbi:hypothetical protein HK102_006739 [Quaeritorhiza haematococci]|nr:hypothetical protein HK102_006739 [Quaeritorhiza haematococci]
MSFLPSALDTKKGTQGNTVPLDPTLLDDLERHAAQIALDLSKMLGNLQEFMAEISAHTLQSVDVHKMAVDNLCEAVEDSMRGTVDLINKVDELSHDMSTVQALSAQM